MRIWPEKFTVDGLLTAKNGKDWRFDQRSYLIEKKYEFILKGLVADGILEGDKVFQPLPKIFGVHEAHQVGLKRWKERSENDRNLVKSQRSVSIATVVIALATIAGSSATIWAILGKPVPELPENNSPPTRQQYQSESPGPSARAGTFEDGLCVVELPNTVQRSRT